METRDPDRSVSTFGALLRRFRLAAGLSQEALAERARISTEAIGALERGARKVPQRQTLALLVAALDLGERERDQLAEAAVRPAVPRRRGELGGTAGVVSALRLPASLTTFVGRDADIADVESALRVARLISLVGTGGVGKSRLALEIGRRVGASFEDGVALVELAPVAEAPALLAAVAAALGIAEEGGVALIDRIAAEVGARSRLLIVDNCEHVREAAGAVCFAMLTRCERLRIVATSREPLRVAGERIVRIGPLPIAQARALFVDRATAVARFLQFPTDKQDVIDDICRRVDGIPLALELVASRTDLLDVETIRDRLRTRFASVFAGAQSDVPHHRTLRALVDWSHDLLDPAEKTAFRRLAVFAGGCRLDDAEDVLAFDGVARTDILDLLARLHDKSLVGVDRSDPPRFEMLQTIRDYAAEQLEAAGESRELEDRSARHFLALAVAVEPLLRSRQQGVAIERISLDIDNIRAALAASHRSAELRESGLRALGALSLYWIRTGALSEGAALIETLVASESEPSLGLAHACAGAAFVEFNRLYYPSAEAYAARAIAAAEAVGDEWTSVYTSLVDFAARSNRGETGHRAGILVSRERAERLGDRWLVGAVDFELGQLALTCGDYQEAAGHFRAVLEGVAETGDEFMVCAASLALGKAIIGDEPATAARYIVEAYDCLAPRAVLSRAACEDALAAIALELRNHCAAARLLGIARAHRRAGAGAASSPLADTVRRGLNDDVFAREFPIGDATPTEEADATVRGLVASLLA